MNEIASKQEIRRRKKELMLRYAYQFRELRQKGLHVPPGWLDLFMELCGGIDQALTTPQKRAFYWTDAREKLGTLRLFWAGYRSVLRFGRSAEPQSRECIEGMTKDLLNSLIRNTERASEKVCMFCGAPGKLRAGIGWASTTCEEHRNTSFRYLTDL